MSKEPKRPATVPARARWVAEDNVWRLGRTKSIFHYGEHRVWRADGSLYGIEPHDQYGRRDGRFEYFHPDGTLANAQVWKAPSGKQGGPTKLTETWQHSKACPAKHPVCECWMLGKPKRVWRYEINSQTDATKYFLADGTPCDKAGKPRGGKAPAPKRPKFPPTKNALVKAWRELEGLLHDRGMAWALHYAPPTLAWEKAPKWAATADELLPADYLAFVKEVGYPMLGVKLYCDLAWSFLPPAVLRFQATECFGPGVEEPTKRVLAAFFAGYRDLADITGYAFALDKTATKVWKVGDAVARTPIGSFTDWMSKELVRLTKWATALPPKKVAALVAAYDGEEDPHRLIDYAG